VICTRDLSNQRLHENAAIPLLFHVERHRRGVGDPCLGGSAHWPNSTLMKKAPNGQFLLGALALSLAALFTGCPSTPTPIPAELIPLQGYWEGEGYKTTFTLPAGTDPQQLHATIKEYSPPTNNAIGKVVFAIFKIEDGTLTLAEDDMSDEPPKTFPSASIHYDVKKVQPQRRIPNQPKPNEPKTP